MKHINEVISRPSQITHLTGASNYTWVHFRDGATVLLSKPLSYFEEYLPDFVRVHKVAMVNPHYIQQIQSPPRAKTPGSVTLQNGVVLPVSRRRWPDVTDALDRLTRLENSEFTQLANNQRGVGESLRGRVEQETGVPSQLITPPSRQVYAVIKDDVKSLLLQQILQEKWPQCTVRFFANGSSLIDHIALREPPALVLLDIRTVGWNGLNALEELKRDKRLRAIPTVVFISNQSGNDVEVCYATGANSVISQTGSHEEFKNAVERICQYWLNFAALPIARSLRA
ncbi:response regulator [Spirosoma taeanense]|uniref:Response regulator n=1 Tax=Spirosoma taeanense TaxID=2735870 RepID=A0A6M5Y5C8_9BACT|nr:LytTR family transcriptional regulator DNA-binding domain-containing protein [Spirosoma taeanense]QJW89029.1 response regulator [Spirosoma taeanense]